ncbi:MAG: polysaccharide deacetylase family protein [Clostridiales bacterium]|nr:polysaccharide deacetylase family protein [Eubacterium sp.]MDD7349522.1 polysaccharide deacetylase family protein [Clostridiales bacterium]MDY3773931.1 polysaccharide deacetylase family protein [Eubacterium sp.]
MSGRREYRKRQWRRRQSRKLELLLKGSMIAAVVLVLVLIGIKVASTVQSRNEQKRAEEALNQQQEKMVETPLVEEPTPPPTPVPKDKAVALTFDDGPSRDNDGKIIETLQANGAHATFFVLGNRARVDGDIMQMITGAGCEIASHSWDHPQLSKIKWKKVKSQLKRTDDIVAKLLNGYQITLLRPPYGSISKTMRKKIDKPMILWSLDTLDWKTRNAKKIFNGVKKEVKDGDIILMHDIHPETAEALTKIVPWLSEQGYDMLTVSELMERKGKKLEAGKAYLDAN